MADAGLWKPYTQGQGQLQPAFVRPFAEIKQAMGFRRVRLRGLANVRGEWDLVSAACNLRRLFALTGTPA